MTPEHAYVRTSDIVHGNLWRVFPVINVDRVKDIPCDYPGAMGVPFTVLDKLYAGTTQFEVLGLIKPRLESGRQCFRRLIIRNLHPDLPEMIDLVDWMRRTGLDIDFEFAEALPADAMPLYRVGGDGDV